MRVLPLSIALSLLTLSLAPVAVAERTQGHSGSFLMPAPYVDTDPTTRETIQEREPADPCIEPWREDVFGSCVELDTPLQGPWFRLAVWADEGDGEARGCFYDAQMDELACFGPGYGDRPAKGPIPQATQFVGIAGLSGKGIHWTFQVHDSYPFGW